MCAPQTDRSGVLWVDANVYTGESKNENNQQGEAHTRTRLTISSGSKMPAINHVGVILSYN